VNLPSHPNLKRCSAIAIACASFAICGTGRGDEAVLSVAKDAALILATGPGAEGYSAATAAARRLVMLPPTATTDILALMSDASPLAKNWLRMIASAVADNDAENFPTEALTTFFRNQSQDDDARHAAFQMLVNHDPPQSAVLLSDAQDDPSLPIRYAAIAMRLREADQLKADGDNEGAMSLYRMIVAMGRNPDQLQAAVKSLDSLGEKLDLADELGLVRQWWAIGTFDNSGSAHFDSVYSPEQTYIDKGKLPESMLKENATIATGDKKTATTYRVTSEDSFGVVNINPAFENAKDAIVYLYFEFETGSNEKMDAVARLGSITASKAWVNGVEVMANEVYHSGSRIDQYLGDCKLVPGVNTVLLKICQNAQTEPWAQDWQFQFRFTDPAGAAILPTSISKK